MTKDEALWLLNQVDEDYQGEWYYPKNFNLEQKIPVLNEFVELLEISGTVNITIPFYYYLTHVLVDINPKIG